MLHGLPNLNQGPPSAAPVVSKLPFVTVMVEVVLPMLL